MEENFAEQLASSLMKDIFDIDSKEAYDKSGESFLDQRRKNDYLKSVYMNGNQLLERNPYKSNIKNFTTTLPERRITDQDITQFKNKLEESSNHNEYHLNNHSLSTEKIRVESLSNLYNELKDGVIVGQHNLDSFKTAVKNGTAVKKYIGIPEDVWRIKKDLAMSQQIQQEQDGIEIADALRSYHSNALGRLIGDSAQTLANTHLSNIFLSERKVIRLIMQESYCPYRIHLQSSS